MASPSPFLKFVGDVLGGAPLYATDVEVKPMTRYWKRRRRMTLEQRRSIDVTKRRGQWHAAVLDVGGSEVTPTPVPGAFKTRKAAERAASGFTTGLDATPSTEEARISVALTSTAFTNRSLADCVDLVHAVLARKLRAGPPPPPLPHAFFRTTGIAVAALPEWSTLPPGLEVVVVPYTPLQRVSLPVGAGVDLGELVKAPVSRPLRAVAEAVAVAGAGATPPRPPPRGTTKPAPLSMSLTTQTARTADPSKAAALKFQRLLEAEAKAASAVQRMFRGRLSVTLLRKGKRRHRAATTISRVWRGVQCRQHVASAVSLWTAAATSIQALCRGFLSRQHTTEEKVVAVRAIVSVQSAARVCLARRMVYYLRRRQYAVKIQARYRGARDRRYVERLRYVRVFVPGMTRLQAVVRGNRARQIYRKLWATAKINQFAVVVLSVVHLRKAKHVLRLLIKAQATARGWICRRRLEAARLLRHRNAAVLRVQAFARMLLAQIEVSKRETRRYLFKRVLPAAAAIQRWWRGCRVRAITGVLLQRLRAQATIFRFMLRARFLQRMRTRFLRAKAEWEALNSTLIQTQWRCFLARRLVLDLRDEQFAEHVLAVRRLQRWWRKHNTIEMCRDAMVAWRVKRLRQELGFTGAEVVYIETDVVDVKEDLKVLAKRMRRDMRERPIMQQAFSDLQKRIPFLENELENATAEDVEAGWVDAFNEELAMSRNMLPMMKEDYRAHAIRTAQRRLDMEDLALELDELEMVLEEEVAHEVRTLEKLRRLELELCSQAYDWDRNRAVARQRSKWRIKDHRRKVVDEYNAGRVEHALGRGGIPDMLNAKEVSVEPPQVRKLLEHLSPRRVPSRFPETPETPNVTKLPPTPPLPASCGNPPRQPRSPFATPQRRPAKHLPLTADAAATQPACRSGLVSSFVTPASLRARRSSLHKPRAARDVEDMFPNGQLEWARTLNAHKLFKNKVARRNLSAAVAKAAMTRGQVDRATDPTVAKLKDDVAGILDNARIGVLALVADHKTRVHVAPDPRPKRR